MTVQSKRPINRFAAAAAGLTLATLVVHVAAGTREILNPVLASDAPPVAREVMRACWHLITLTLAAMSASFAYGIRRRTPALFLAWSLLAAAFGFVFLVVAVSSGLGLGVVPQSVAFVAIAASGFAGLRRSLYLPAGSTRRYQAPVAATVSSVPAPPPSRHRAAH